MRIPTTTRRTLLAGASGEQMADAEDLHRAIEPALAFGLRHAARLEAEHDVLGDIQMGEQGVGLEHHRHAAFGRRQGGDVAAADLDRAGAGLFQAGDDAQAGGLAAAGRA